MLGLVDLFAGTGAFSIGFHETGRVRTIFANDIEATSKKIFDRNCEVPLTLGDINDLGVDTIPKMDILTGGFPCQPFSVAGLRKGFEDKRSNVFWTIMSIIDKHEPRCVVLENVKNLVGHDDGKTFEIIQQEIKNRGYFIKYKVLNTSKVTNIPQNRERIYIVCFKDAAAAELFEFPPEVDELRPISDFLIPVDAQVPAKYYYGDNLKIWDIIKDDITKDVRRDNTIYQLRRKYVRENKKNVCPTLTANMGGGGHNVPLLRDSVGIRKLMPRECFNLQGFPETYVLDGLSDTALYKLAGNAVSVGVVRKIALAVIQALGM